MKYFLGLDGGASKTEAIIINENGEQAVKVYWGPLNYHQLETEQAVHQNLETIIKMALLQSDLPLEDLGFAVFGFAGKDTPEDEANLKRITESIFGGYFKDKLQIASDVEIAYHACLNTPYGLVLIAGTGANCFGKGKDKITARAGDWGYLLGDQGSGFALGLNALRAIMRAYDGRGEKTMLTELILDQHSLPSPPSLVDWIYKRTTPVKEIAGLAPSVFAAYNKNDQVAQRLVDKLIGEMVLSVKSVAQRVNLEKEEFEIGLVGGLFNEKQVINLLEKEIIKVLPKAKLVLAKMEPAMAAAHLARATYQNK